MKRKIIAAVCAVVVTLMPVTSASAGTLTLWEHDNFQGNHTTWMYCNVDFRDNYFNSGEQNIVAWVSVWNNTIWHGDEKIATIRPEKSAATFDRSNAADHVTCYG